MLTDPAAQDIATQGGADIPADTSRWQHTLSPRMGCWSPTELRLEAHFVNSMDEIASIHTASDDTTGCDPVLYRCQASPSGLW